MDKTDLEKMKAGVSRKVGFVVEEKTVLTIPVVAMVHRGEMNVVYVQHDDGQIRMRQIRPGPQIADGQMIVHAGLTEGDKVFIDPLAATIALKQAGGK